jgi:hypothetical protein
MLYQIQVCGQKVFLRVCVIVESRVYDTFVMNALFLCQFMIVKWISGQFAKLPEQFHIVMPEHLDRCHKIGTIGKEQDHSYSQMQIALAAKMPLW